jgi:N-methylhydantoinase B
MAIDPVLLEILLTNYAAIAEEAAQAVKRIGHTLYVTEAEDFAVALVGLDGKFFAYPREVGFLGFLDSDVLPTIESVPDLQPGDVIATNHSYLSHGLCTHSPDMHLVAPIFHDGKIVAYSWSFAHMSDVGGSVPGSISATSTDIFQEGLLLPPVRLCRDDRIDETMLAILNANSRMPEKNLGDIRAMLSAHLILRERVREVIEKHGAETFVASQTELKSYAARRADTVLRKLKNGTYVFWDYLDDLPLSPLPVRFRIEMTVNDGHVHLDFTGTDPQTQAAFNIASNDRLNPYLSAELLNFIGSHDPDIPINAGILANVTATLPRGTIVNPIFPASVGSRGASVIRVADLLLGALYQAAPDMAPAACTGNGCPLTFIERSADGMSQKVMVVQFATGGTGGSLERDGVDGRADGIMGVSNNPIETVEENGSLRILYYGVRPSSGGAGRWRGGAGLMLTLEATAPRCQVRLRGMDRFRFAPWGVAGGQPGERSRIILNIGREDEQELGKTEVVELEPGTTFTVMTAGGGGYGNPFERDPGAVLRDVELGMVTVESARDDYGVVLVEGSVDADATAALRERSQPRSQDISFGEDRTAFDAVFTDELLQRVDRILWNYPASQRTIVRERLLCDAFPAFQQRNVDLRQMLADIPAAKAHLENCIREAEDELTDA